MNKVYSFIISLLITTHFTAQNIAINTTGASANASAMLDISSTSSGLLIPRMTSAQRTAIASPAMGLLVFDTSMNSFYYYIGAGWQILAGSSNGWGLTGNTSTAAGTNFIGTTDAVDFVTKTNGIEKMRVTSAGNVGIGNSTPNAPLQFANAVANRKIVLFESSNNDHQFLGFGINGSILRYQVDQASASHVFYAGSGSTSSNELLRIQGNGNVGIGNSSPNAPLQFANTVANRKIVLFENANNDHEIFGFGMNPYILRYQVSSTFANHVFYAATGASSSNEIMRIQGNGNVGIGTAAPTAKLEVNGNLKITDGNQGAGKVLTSDASGLATWVAPNTGGTLSGGTINYIPKWNSSTSLSSASMLFDNGGAVGVGTINPGATLDIAGTLRVGNDVWHTSTDGILRSFYETNGNSFFATGNGYNFLNATYANVLTILNGGNVGIGTTSPNAKLEVSGSLRVGNDVAHTTTDGLYRLFFANNGGTFFGTGNGYAFDNSTFTKIVTFKDNGDVGIGTETPAAKLEVVGSLRLGNDVWHTSSEGKNRLYYNANGGTFMGSSNGYYFSNSANNTILSLYDNGTLQVANDVQHTTMDGISRNYYTSAGRTFFGTGNGYTFANSVGSFIFNVNDNGELGIANDVWHKSIDNQNRMFFATNGTTFFGSPNGEYEFRNGGGDFLIKVLSNGFTGFGTLGPAGRVHAVDRSDANKRVIIGEASQIVVGNHFQNIGVYGYATGANFSGYPTGYAAGVMGIGNASGSHNAVGVYAGLGSVQPSIGFLNTATYSDGANLGYSGIFMNGSVGIGCTNPTQALSVNGNIYATGTVLGAQAACSDIRFKKDFKQLDNSLSKLLKLSGYYYHFKTEEFVDRHFSKEKQLGMKAQEVEALFPELVFTDSAGYKYLDYARLTPVLVEAMKEQQNMIEELKKENTALKTKTNQTSKEMMDLKASVGALQEKMEYILSKDKTISSK